MKTILIIEDDDFFRELIRKKLSTEFNFIEAINGEAGIATMKEKKPDLVLLDLLLPNMDGFEVITQVKSDPAIAAIPIIVLSNLGQKEDIDRVLKLGANDYLIKSQFDIDQVIDKIKGILDQAAQGAAQAPPPDQAAPPPPAM